MRVTVSLDKRSPNEIYGRRQCCSSRACSILIYYSLDFSEFLDLLNSYSGGELFGFCSFSLCHAPLNSQIEPCFINYTT